MRKETKFGEVEYAKRVDGKFAVYKYMADPTIDQPDVDDPHYSDYLIGRWVQVDVIEQLPRVI